MTQKNNHTEANPQVTTRLTWRDTLGAWKARWGIKRMNYNVSPGLYRLGNPGPDSPVLVTANYKLTFDHLRRKLEGINAWIMVLDTKGINVWCAAGKGTFGTEEVIRRVEQVNLTEFVNHRNLILPQLGAPGVAAHEVRRRSGFKVIYGPIRAKDLPAYLRSGMEATPQMRKVSFCFSERMTLIPMELVGPMKILIPVLALLAILIFVSKGTFSAKDLLSFIPYLGAVLAGGALVPLLLPWIPGRAFAWKGWLVGLLWAAAVNFLSRFFLPSPLGWSQMLANLLLLPALSSYLAMNFTGSSNFTSLSGVVKEMKFALPLLILSGGAGLILTLANFFIHL